MSGISRRQVLIAGALFAGAAAIGARGAAQAGWFGLGSDDTGPVYTGLVDGVAVGGYDLRPTRARLLAAAQDHHG